jgi:DnaJ-class molecular chaperone
MICPICQGYGWYSDHSDIHAMNSDLDCWQCGCPVQRECENCQGKGFLIDDIPNELNQEI